MSNQLVTEYFFKPERLAKLTEVGKLFHTTTILSAKNRLRVLWLHSLLYIRLPGGLSRSPVRRFRTHRLIRCVIRPWSLNVLERNLKTRVFAGHWRHERIRGVTVSRNRAVQIDIRILTYSLN